MGLNKRAFFFTSISILVLSILMIGIVPLPTDMEIERIPTIENRVLTANNYVHELSNDYIPKALLASSRSALRSYSNYIINEKKFETNETMRKNLFSLMLYGNSTHENLKNNHSLVRLLNNVSKMVNDSMRLQTEITYANYSYFSIYQDNTTGPWKIAVNYSLNYSIVSDLAKWNISKRKYNIEVHIDNLPDAYLSINSNKSFNLRNITPSEYVTWNYTSFKNHFNNQTYTWSNVSPNFLSRLHNDTSPGKDTGMHTIIGTQSGDLGGSLEGGFYNKSFIDFCYFSDKCDEIYYNVTKITNETYPFRIDRYHLRHYMIGLNSSELYN